jgi:hypothetical protein
MSCCCLINLQVKASSIIREVFPVEDASPDIPSPRFYPQQMDVEMETIDLTRNVADKHLCQNQSDLKRVQFLHCRQLCFFPHCNLKSARRPVKVMSSLHAHHRNYHNTPEENEYKRQFIGKLFYKSSNLDGRMKLVRPF